MKVKPAEGRAVRDPRSYALLPAEGKEVNERDMYWARRLRDGDVVPVDTPPPARRLVRDDDVVDTPARRAQQASKEA